MTTPQTGLGMGAPPPRAGTACIRGVVINVYFADEAGAREDRAGGELESKVLSADVLTYGGPRRGFLARVPIVQHRHGLTDHAVDPIRPTTIDLSTGEPPVLERTDGQTRSDPRDLDGDHVVVEFFENDPLQPFIRDTLPHPRAALRQLKSSGFEKRVKFRGVELSIDQNGNLRVDASNANDGRLFDGEEQAADDSSHGRMTVLLPRSTTMAVQGISPNGVVKTFELTLKEGEFEVRLNDGDSFKVSGNGDATEVTIGSGGSSAVRGERLQAQYEELKAVYDEHTHPDGFGSTAPPVVQAPTWGANILSTVVKLPDT